MNNYKIDGSVINITLDNGKTVKVSTEWAERSIKALDTDMDDVLLMWLEDNGYLDNDEQNELDQKAKANKSNKVIGAKADKPKKKTQKERVRKDNPTKELIISTLAEALKPLNVDNLVIENKGKLITFTYAGEDFKLDLVQKRKKKDE